MFKTVHMSNFEQNSSLLDIFFILKISTFLNNSVHKWVGVQVCLFNSVQCSRTYTGVKEMTRVWVKNLKLCLGGAYLSSLQQAQIFNLFFKDSLFNLFHI